MNVVRGTVMAVCLLTLPGIGRSAPPAEQSPNAYVRLWNPDKPGIAYGFATATARVAGSSEPLRDFTVAAQLTAKNGRGVDQWAFGAATEAWAMPGSRSVLVGIEAAVINEEPLNVYPKVANNAVMKNRSDEKADPGAPLNANSIAYWITAQPGTGFERGLVFGRGALMKVAGRAAAIDLSDIPDEAIGEIDLIRIRSNVALRYDPATKQLVLHVD
jgi:hypothetical protein